MDLEKPIVQFVEDLEIRHLPLKDVLKIAKILESSDGWKRLMAIIPKNLEDIDNNEEFRGKYSIEEIQLIENNVSEHKTGFEILVQEWGTSGRNRPKLKHLLLLLQKAELFRAMEYVNSICDSTKMVSIPENGPGQKIDLEAYYFDLSLTELSDPKTSDLRLNATGYTGTLNNDYYEKRAPMKDKVDPQILISCPTNSVIPDLDALMIEVSGLLRTGTSYSSQQHPKSNASNDVPCNPKLTELFGRTCIQEKRSSFQHTSENGSGNAGQPSGRTISTLDGILNPEQRHSEDCIIPNFDILNSGNSTNSINVNSRDNDNNIPAISILNVASESINIPNLEVLQDSNVSSVTSSEIESSKVQSASISLIDFNSRDDANNMPDLSALNIGVEVSHHQPQNNVKQNTVNFELKSVISMSHFSQIFYGKFGNSEIAVKYLNMQRPGHQERFGMEVETLLKISHPNIIKLLGFSSSPQSYLVYEFVPNGTLSMKLQNCQDGKDQMQWNQRITILNDCIRALKFLHSPEINVIYGNLKPENILLTENGPTKLCDFKFLRKVGHESTNTAAQHCDVYSIENFSRITTPVVDVYSFGMVLLEIITELKAFDTSRIHAHLIDYLRNNFDGTGANLLKTDNIPAAVRLLKIGLTFTLNERDRPTSFQNFNIFDESFFS